MRRKNEIVSRKYIDHVKCILDMKDTDVIALSSLCITNSSFYEFIYGIKIAE